MQGVCVQNNWALEGDKFMNLRSTRAIAATMAIAAVIAPTTAHAEGSFDEAVRNTKLYIDERYRYEHVDQANFDEDARASTLRTRFGVKTGSYRGFLIVAEYENVTNIGDDRFNNTINGLGMTYPAVLDVESSELNQLFLQYTGLPDTKVKVGRQVIVVDNMRYIGHVGWRQNNQTFDAVTVQNTSIKGVTLSYGYIEGVNRIFGNDSPNGDWDSDSHYINASTKLPGIGKLTGYGYFLDFEEFAPTMHSSTVGGFFGGKRDMGGFGLHYHAEYAHQSDYGDNPVSYDADYYHFILGLSRAGFKASIGYEVLGSDDGNFAFQTPLATGHKFNGWADQFLPVTRPEGLRDFYIDLTYKLKGIDGHMSLFNGLLLKAQYHDFSSDEGSIDYGTEWGLYAKMPLVYGLYLEAKYADYNADQHNFDTEKFTVGVGWKREFAKD